MNIFVLAYRPEEAARYHCDKHVVKMVLETAQILSTALRLNGVDDPTLYPITHRHHPCVKWAAMSHQSFAWLCQLGIALLEEYEWRYDKVHACTDIIFHARDLFLELPHRLRPPFVKAMPERYKRRCPVASYRAYYNGEKQHLHKWTRRLIPSWIGD